MTEPLAYRPDRFAKTIRLPDARKLWHWLQTPEVLTIMTTASYLRRPAVEPLSPLLSDRFPALMSRHTGRQMAGHMIRQVLESEGFHLDRSNVRIDRKTSLFRRGSSYTR